MDLIYFSIPGFYVHNKINRVFFDFFQNHSEYFCDDIVIESCIKKRKFEK
jgi:hypothetical protein